MAVKKVILNGSTIMTVEDTTAVESDVAQGKIFYKSNGDKAIGTNTGSGGSQPVTPENGFVVDNNDNLTVDEERYMFKESPYSGRSILKGEVISGAYLYEYLNSWVTIGEKKLTYNVALSYYQNNNWVSQTWVSPQITTEIYDMQLRVRGDKYIDEQWFYCTPTYAILDENDQPIIIDEHSSLNFKLDSVNIVRYTSEEAYDFIDVNNIYYNDNNEKESLAHEIVTRLAKSASIVFKQYVERGTEENPFTAQQAYDYMRQTFPNGGGDGTYYWLSDVVTKVYTSEKPIIELGQGVIKIYGSNLQSIPNVGDTLRAKGMLLYYLQWDYAEMHDIISSEIISAQ